MIKQSIIYLTLIGIISVGLSSCATTYNFNSHSTKTLINKEYSINVYNEENKIKINNKLNYVKFITSDGFIKKKIESEQYKYNNFLIFKVKNKRSDIMIRMGGDEKLYIIHHMSHATISNSDGFVIEWFDNDKK